jgi:hypothetical protein
MYPCVHCDLKTPKGLDTGDPGYTITAYEDLGSGFVAVPSSSTAANPVVVHFK